ncbi:MAG: glycoside hydrolase, partial [Cyclobacteriaceae bacterium]|nr:glycoside hydrolase [Cyclobacteriaceae bacterium]
PDGSLLAFAEGRVHGSNDFGNIDIVMKKSQDGGKSWSSIQVVADNNELQAGNPAPVVDLLDPQFPQGRIFLFYNTGNQSEYNNRLGLGVREVLYRTSEDGGKSWSEPTNITQWVHRPNNPDYNLAYRFPEDWRSYANTPGHAIQLQTGDYKGRIYIAANHSEGPPQEEFRDYFSHGFFSDDHGKTFKISEKVELEGSNEAMAVEIGEGKLMMNIRNQQGNVRSRIIAISNSGGFAWDTVYFDNQLPDPVCQGSILALNGSKSESLLAFINNAHTIQRDDLTLRLSVNNGESWKKKTYYIDGSKNHKEGNYSTWTAYSDLVQLNKNTLGVLYERFDYSEIVFKVIEL